MDQGPYRYQTPQLMEDEPAQPRAYQTPQTMGDRPQPVHRSRRGKRRPRISWPRLLTLILSVGVMLYAGGRLILYAIDSVNTYVTNLRLQAMYVMAPQETVTEAPVITAAPTPSPTAAPAARAAAVTAAPLPTATPRLPMRTDFQFLGSTTRKEMQELWKANHDLVGWLKIPGVVDLPVVYRDNDYYLKRDFYKKRSNGGTLFLDVHHPLRPENQYLVIHGHNMKDGSMFGLLAHYEDREYALKHPTVYWSTLYREEVYKVFAVLVVPTNPSDSHFVPYLGVPRFDSQAHFDSFIGQVRKNARYLTGEKVTSNDALLTLSTCLDDDRIVVLCKRVTPY